MSWQRDKHADILVCIYMNMNAHIRLYIHTYIRCSFAEPVCWVDMETYICVFVVRTSASSLQLVTDRPQKTIWSKKSLTTLMPTISSQLSSSCLNGRWQLLASCRTICQSKSHKGPSHILAASFDSCK